MTIAAARPTHRDRSADERMIDTGLALGDDSQPEPDVTVADRIP
jgi:hypothetical protein